jgi:DNA-binding HxlR family transcriptional regulator
MWNAFDDRCPTRLVLSRVADKWTVLIVSRLARRTMRFGELKRDIAGISQKMLTQTLRGLERDGVIARTVYPEVPLRVEYCLTPLGTTLASTLVQIEAWAEGNIEAVLAAQRAYDQAAGQPVQPQSPARVVRLASRAA